MRNIRTISWLFAGIVALSVANFLLIREGVESRLVKRLTLVDRSLEDVGTIRIRRAGVRETTLVRTDDGWRIREPFVGQMDVATANRFLDALQAAPVAEEMSYAELLRLGRSPADFDLTEPPLAVELVDESETCRLSFGARTPAGDGVYAMVDGSDSVYITSTNAFAAVDLRAEDFRLRRLFPVPAESVSGLDLRLTAGNNLSLARENDGWRLSGSPAAASKVKAFVGTLVDARAVSYVWPTGATNESTSVSGALLAVYGLDPESALSVTLRTLDGAERRVAFGMDAGENLVYALVENGGAIVTVSSTIAETAKKGAAAFADERLFPVEAASVAAYSLADADTVYLVARDADGGWRLDSPVAAPADPTVAAAILDRALTLSTSDAAESGIRVSVATNLPAATVAPASLFGDRRLEDLRSKDILSFDPALVKRLVSTRGRKETTTASVVFVRERKAWNVETENAGGTADEAAIARILAALAPLRAARVEKLKVSPSDLARYGLDTPELVIAVDQDRADSVRRNILIGAPCAGGRYATVGASEAVFALPEKTVRELSLPLIAK